MMIIAGHAGDRLDDGRAVMVGVVPIEAGRVVVGDFEHVIEMAAGLDRDHRRERIGGAERHEQMRP